MHSLQITAILLPEPRRRKFAWHSTPRSQSTRGSCSQNKGRIGMETGQVWAGLDTGIKSTSVCLIDNQGKVLLEETCPTNSDIVGDVLLRFGRENLVRVCIEAGVANEFIRQLRNQEFPVFICETKRSAKFLGIRRQKTDRNDAAGLADLGRLAGEPLREVHLKSLECQQVRTKLVTRQKLLRTRQSCDALIQSTIRMYGGDLKLRWRHGSIAGDTDRQLELMAANGLDIEQDLRPLITTSEYLRHQLKGIDKRLKTDAENDPVCKRLLGVPGVGPLTALSFYSVVEDPSRFPIARDIGPFLGLTPSLYSSGIRSRSARISKIGNKLTRSNLVSAATVLLNISQTDCALKRWGDGLSARIGRGKARIAVARKIAVLMLHLWKTETEFDPEYGLT